jgi:hypothetical protein
MFRLEKDTKQTEIEEKKGAANGLARLCADGTSIEPAPVAATSHVLR